MFNKLKKIRNYLKKKHDVSFESNIKQNRDISTIRIKASLLDNIDNIEKVFGKSSDLKIRKFNVADKILALVYIEGLTSETDLNQFFINFLSEKVDESDSVEELFTDKKIPSTNIEDNHDFSDAIKSILDGYIVVLIDGVNTIYSLDFITFDKRNVEDSQLEKNLRGPRDAFIEDLTTNIALLRKKIKNANFQVDKLTIGTRTNTDIAIVYIRDIANPEIVSEAKKRIGNIDYDSIQDGTYIAHLISDNPITIFPLMKPTEKPDKVVSNLLYGRIAIICDNSPTAILLPTVYSDFFHVQDDMYDRFYSSIMGRITRYLGALLAVLSTPLYIALTGVNIDMLPTKLAIPFSQVRYVVPFPLVVEALLMEITLEVLREAGLRIPNPIGPAVSIVGGLVVGQTAVNAGLISPFLTIIVAVSAIGSFTITAIDLVNTLRVVKFLLLISAGVFGLYGLGACATLLVLRCCSLTSFGVPYFAPFSEEGIGSSILGIFRRPLIIDSERYKHYRIKNIKKVNK